MQVIRSLDGFPDDLKGASLAIGNFDGLHAGHRKVIGLALDEAKRLGAPVGVLTFDPPPGMFFRPDAPPSQIQSLSQRAALMEQIGVDFCLAPAFDAEIALMSDHDFCQNMLHEQLGVKSVAVGFDFHFGKGRQGDVTRLAQYGEGLGFTTRVAAAVTQGDEKHSSTRIRRALREGDMTAARDMLGDYWTIESEVVHGEKRGRTLGFPTANLYLGHFLHPRYGIYTVWGRIEGETMWRPGVANFGRTPTTGLRDPLLEVFFLDWSGDLYGKTLEVAFAAFQRPEESFDTLDALVAQMEQDSANARAFLSTAALPGASR